MSAMPAFAVDFRVESKDLAVESVTKKIHGSSNVGPVKVYWLREEKHMNWLIQHGETEVVMCLVSSQFWWIFLCRCNGMNTCTTLETHKNCCCVRQPGFHPSNWQIWQHMMWHPSLVRHLQPPNVHPDLWWHQIYRPVWHPSNADQRYIPVICRITFVFTGRT